MVYSGRVFVMCREDHGDLENESLPPRDLPLRPFAALGAFGKALVGDARKGFFEQVPVGTLVLVGRHRGVSPASACARTARHRTGTASPARRRRRPAAAPAGPTAGA